MKKIFKIISICALTCFSFYYTKEAIELSKSKDPIMQKIIKESENYNISPVNAIIDNDYIYPGTSGKKVDINKSYEKMKRLGEYNENLLVFINDYPSISIKDNYDKFIVRGKNDAVVSLIFKLDNTNNIEKILKILNKKNIQATFFIDGSLIEINQELVKTINEKNHIIGNAGYNNDYTNLKKVNALIKNITKNDPKYCYVNSDNIEVLKKCAENNMYTIKPKKINDTHAYSEIKKTIENGSILELKNNDYTINELEIIINYITQKGYKIVSLDEILNE